MTNPNTTASDLITAATPDIQWIFENTECPRLPEWCDIKHRIIEPTQYTNGIVRHDADNPPAVLAAIVVWVSEVCMWGQCEDMLHMPDMPQLIIDRNYNPYWLSQSWTGNNTLHDTYTEASLALLSAIVSELKGGA